MIHMRLFAIGLCAMAVVGCKARAAQPSAAATVVAAESSPSTPELILKSYDVPPGQTQQVRSVLRSTFAGMGESAPRAEATPDGQLLVVGPAGIHSGVEQFLARMAERKAPAPPTVELEYWFVVAQPAPETAVGPGLQQIAPALQAVAQAQGAMRFDRLESMRLRSQSDEHGKARGNFAGVDQRVSVIGGQIVADLELEAHGGSRLETRLSLTPDEVIVMGETGIVMQRLQPSPLAGEGSATMFYIVRATIHDAI